MKFYQFSTSTLFFLLGIASAVDDHDVPFHHPETKHKYLRHLDEDKIQERHLVERIAISKQRCKVVYDGVAAGHCSAYFGNKCDQEKNGNPKQCADIIESLGGQAPFATQSVGRWTTVANNHHVIPGSGGRVFNSYNPPSVDGNGLVVFRGRAGGGHKSDKGQVSGIYTRDMGVPNSLTVKQFDRCTAVPDPNTIKQYDHCTATPDPNNLMLNRTNVKFNEFPSFPQISRNQKKIATRGMHPPVYIYDDTRGGTTGLYVNLNAEQSQTSSLITAANNLGHVSGFEFWSVPGTDTGISTAVFPGSPSITDDNYIAFKANWEDTSGSNTGVFARQLEDKKRGGANSLKSIASTYTVIPNTATTACDPGTKFGSTAPPSADGTRMVFVGSDYEDDPKCGGIYMANMDGENNPELTSLITLGDTKVPGTDETFTRVAEALAFDGKYVAFWGTWDSETKKVRNDCPEHGNRDRRFFCKCSDTQTTKVKDNETAYDASCLAWETACGSESEEGHGHSSRIEGEFYQEMNVPKNQGIFVMDVDDSSKKVSLVADTSDNGFDDFIFWHYSGAPPCAGGLEEEDDREPPRFRSSPFISVASNEDSLMVMFKARKGKLSSTGVWEETVDGIYLNNLSPAETTMTETSSVPEALVETAMFGKTDFDQEAVIPETITMGDKTVNLANKDAPLSVDEVAIEREGVRVASDGTFHVTLALGFSGKGKYVEDGVEEESDIEFAGIYYRTVP